MEKQSQLAENKRMQEPEPMVKRFKNVFHTPAGIVEEEVIKITRLLRKLPN